MQRIALSRLSLLNLTLMLVLTALANPVAVSAAESVVELEWEALIPNDWKPVSPFEKLTDDQLNQLTDGSPIANELYDQLNEIRNSAPVVEALNGKLVKLPGFVVPLEFDGTEVSEFLLVPYFGACIHVPPPPANQIVYVKSQKKVPIDGLFDVVWVTGRLNTLRFNSDLGEAGYTLEASDVVPYE